MFAEIGILFFCVLKLSASAFMCASTHEVNLKSNQILFFQSPNFLNDYKLNQNESLCEMNFRHSEKENKRFQLVITHSYHAKSGFESYRNYESMQMIVLNTTEYKFNQSYEELPFQGFALFDEWIDDCPLESISKYQPFLFTDETQVFTLSSHYNINYTRKQPCLWQFNAPPGFGFKIIITHLRLINTLELKIENSTELLKTQQSVINYFPYYNSDNYLKVSLSAASANYSSTELEFAAYITIVKNNQNKTISNCTLSKNGTSWISQFAYSNNAKCKHELLIPSKMEVIITPYLAIEPNIDYIKYSVENKTSILSSSTIISGYSNDTEKNVLFEFVSDGSVRGAGFDIRFKFIECKCSDPVITIDCDEDFQRFSVMNNKFTSFHEEEDYINYYYCENLKCNYTVKINESCSDKFIYMSFTLHAKDDGIDIFRVFTNDVVVLEYKNKGYPNDRNRDYTINFSPNVKNFIQIITKSSSYAIKNLQIDFSAVEAPTVSHWINFTTSMTEYFAGPEVFTGNLIIAHLSQELILQNYELEIHGSINSAIVYENENLNKPLNPVFCSTEGYPFCTFKTNKVVIYGKDKYGGQLFFYAANRNLNNCRFRKNVFNTDFYRWSQNIYISAMANEKGPCKIYLFGEESTISDVYTTAKNTSVIVYATGRQQKIFKFNKTTSKLWKSLLPLNQYYSFEIPANTSLLLTMKETTQFVIIDKYPYKTALSFSLSSDWNVTFNFVFSYYLKKYNALLKVSKFNISNDYDMYLKFINGSIIRFSTFNILHIPAETKFDIYYSISKTNIKSWDPEVLLYLETTDNTPPTTEYDKNLIHYDNNVFHISINFWMIVLCVFNQINR